MSIRKSNLELLRILCIFGILTMHSFGQFASTCTGVNLIYGVFINSIFNMGVSCFMLITGYFGVNFSLKKVLKLELSIISYGILGQFVIWVGTGTISYVELFKSFFPITTGKYWYMSVYMIIVFCSKYINALIEKFDKEESKLMIFILVLLFYLMPSLGYFEIMKDSGKGIANMLTMYLTGRYIYTYHNEKMSSLKFIVAGTGIIGCGFIINCLLSMICGGEGIIAPLARDNSIIIYLGSICVFLAFKNMNFYKKNINLVAGSVFAMYLFEETIRRVINHFIDISAYGDNVFLFVVIIVYVDVIMVICFVIEMIRKSTIGKLEPYIIEFAMKCCQFILNRIKTLNVYIKYISKI